MDDKKENRRVRYTKMVLRDTLLDLLKTKPINRITVTDICQQADLNRGTFYNYYCDAYDLLSQIEDEFFDELLQTIKRFEDGVSDSLLVELLTTVDQNRALCQIILTANADQTYANRILDLTRAYTLKYWENNNVKNLTEAEMDLLYTFFSNGSLGVLKKWINYEYNVPIDDLAKTIQALGIKGAECFFGDELKGNI